MSAGKREFVPPGQFFRVQPPCRVQAHIIATTGLPVRGGRTKRKPMPASAERSQRGSRKRAVMAEKLEG